MAEASLMALLEAMLSLAVRPSLVRRPTPNIKAGGYPDEIFLDLTDEKRDEYECSICYLMMKDVMECRNKHKFCFSCIQVWSTTGEFMNRVRCPVCRCEGHYTKNPVLDTKILMNRVRCTMKGCDWKGLLKYAETHKHSNYQTSSNSSSTNLPPLKDATPRPTESRSVLQPRSNTRSRLTPSISDPNNNSISIDSNDNSNDPLSPSVNADTESDQPSVLSPRAPVPPRTPRPNPLARRRFPTLPSLINHVPPSVPPASTSGSGLLTRRRASQNLTPATLRPTNETGGRGLTTVRDRLVESRNRLEGLVSTYSDDADQHVEVPPLVYDLQLEQGNLRRQQLQEVQELGRRLGQVAAELRQLLDHRQIVSRDSDSD
ncbi:uncharacterized protein LOC126827728 [Patella vulgata]|uniref:uncharacterized protein LOC126827728 n=1 Tax=Patella vulgata TaxID=6465 RepID=UPI00217FC48D|nr:uncharacterized protein LOC126827728 [Patella vulgata]